jgi:hypothetical protein
VDTMVCLDFPQHLQLRSLEPATDVRTPPVPPTTVPSRDYEPRAASHSANTMQNRTEMPIFLNSGFDISPFSQHCCLPWHYTSASLQVLHWVRPTILHSPCWLCKKISLMKRDLFFVVCAKRQMTREFEPGTPNHVSVLVPEVPQGSKHFAK